MSLTPSCKTPARAGISRVWRKRLPGNGSSPRRRARQAIRTLASGNCDLSSRAAVRPRAQSKDPETPARPRASLPGLQVLTQQALEREPVVAAQFQFRAVDEHDCEFTLRQWQQFAHAADVDQGRAMYAHEA